MMEALSSLARRDTGVNSSSLTFGFSFMGILLVMLIAASLLQRHIAARERFERMRLGLTLDGLAADYYGYGRGREEVPKLWDVRVEVKKEEDPCALSLDEKDNASMNSKEEGSDLKWKWRNIQPLAVHNFTPPHRPALSRPSATPKPLKSSKSTMPPASTHASTDDALEYTPSHVSIIIAMPGPPIVREAPFRPQKNDLDSPMSPDSKSSTSQRTGRHGLYYEIGVADVTKY